MAASSSSWQQNVKTSGLPGIEQEGERRQASESSQLYDVFINHRGPDVKTTFALQLYEALQAEGLRVFHDSKEKQLGKSFPSTIEMAIRSSVVQIAIFSKGYAESSWCLAELVLMLESESKVIPVFYGVKPWELRHIEKGQYAVAFSDYEKKERHLELLDGWKKALHSVSLITGYEVNDSDIDNPEKQVFDLLKLFQDIVSEVKKVVQRTKPLHVAQYPVRLEQIVKDFKTRYGLGAKEKEKAMVIGIYGMGGLGKTTLSKELFNRWRSEYTRACFLFDVREACTKGILPSLQTTLLKELFGAVHPGLHSVEEGTTDLWNCLERSSNLNFLIVLDDIDDVEQLHALMVLRMVAKARKCLLIVTTRYKSVLENAGIALRYKLSGMAESDGRELFCWYAFRQSHPGDGYEELVNGFVEVCRGVPLALRVLGAHVHGKTQKTFWGSALNRARKTMPQGILRTLQISFDSLEDNEKDIFIDIACFFIQKPRSIGIRVWDRSGWDAEHAVEILEGKCLIEEKESSSGLCQEDRVTFRMHDHLRDLGREMAKQRHPRRLWLPQDLKPLELKGFQNILKETNGRCFHSFFDRLLDCKITFFSEKWDGSAATSASLLWLQLEGEFGGDTSIPSWVPLQDLECLRISNPHLKRLWQSNVQAPYPLKELHIYKHSLEEFSESLEMFSDLENVLLDADKMAIEGWSLLVFLRIFPMTLRLNSSTISGKIAFNNERESSLVILNFRVTGEVAFTNGRESTPIMSRLKELEIDDEKKVTKVLIDGNHCSSLEDLRLHQMRNLREVNLKRVKTLSCLKVNYCTNLKSLSGMSDITKLARLDFSDCPKLELDKCLSGVNWSSLEYLRLHKIRNLMEVNVTTVKRLSCLIVNECRNLRSLSGISGIAKLAKLDISECPMLELDPCLSGLNWSSLEYLRLHQIKNLMELNLKTIKTLSCLKVNMCRNLRSLSGISGITQLAELDISECPMLELELCLAGLNCLERIRLYNLIKLKRFELNSCKNLKVLSGFFCGRVLAKLSIRDCPELDIEELVVQGPNNIESIVIDGCRNISNLKLYDCENLKSVSVSGNFAPLTSLEKISIIRCGKLQSLSLPTPCSLVKLKYCENLRRVTATSDWTKLVRMEISVCPKLEELPECFADLTSLEEIFISRCGKLQSISLPTALSLLHLEFCGELKRVTATSHLTKLVRLTICECPKLEELSSLGPLRCVLRIRIECCEKLQDIPGIEELHRPYFMRLSNCGNAAVRNFIFRLESLPSYFGEAIGRAVDGAESILNQHLFSEVIGIDAVSEIDSKISVPFYLMASQASMAIKQPRDSLSTIIICAVVDVDSSVSGHSSHAPDALSQGTWIVTLIINWEEVEVNNRIRNYGMMKKACVVSVKKGQEGKALLVLRRIIHKLYDK